MRVTVNGEPHDLPATMTVADLVADLALSQRRIAVEVNCDIVPRERYATHPLRDGDAVEIVHFIGGG
ncbi:MAG: sulfur carrier protein ThiS [Deltaproteobacteria bacterium]|nr:sulfur carrier protein ThiS [Deltaproteobacteria bacterium]